MSNFEELGFEFDLFFIRTFRLHFQLKVFSVGPLGLPSSISEASFPNVCGLHMSTAKEESMVVV